MAKDTKSVRSLPTIVEEALRALGRDINVARRRRRIPQRVMADRMMVNVETLHRVEKGDPTVGIGIIASALWVLGMQERLRVLIAPETDKLGQDKEMERLPQAVREPSSPGMDF